MNVKFVWLPILVWSKMTLVGKKNNRVLYFGNMKFILCLVKSWSYLHNLPCQSLTSCVIIICILYCTIFQRWVSEELNRRPFSRCWLPVCRGRWWCCRDKVTMFLQCTFQYIWNRDLFPLCNQRIFTRYCNQLRVLVLMTYSTKSMTMGNMKNSHLVSIKLIWTGQEIGVLNDILELGITGKMYHDTIGSINISDIKQYHNTTSRLEHLRSSLNLCIHFPCNKWSWMLAAYIFKK